MPGGHIYLTVEEVDPGLLDEAFAATAHVGLPAVHGEDVGDDTAGYHYYPSRDRISRWLEDAGIEVVEEADEALDGYGYHHLLLRH
jgi:hypothetical protein